MAFRANPIRTLLRSLASVACLLAILLLTTPCSMAQSSSAPAMHCANCCDGNPALNAPQTCCDLHTQPARPTEQALAIAAVQTAEAVPAPPAVLAPEHRTILTRTSTSPPLLLILRV